ncbi:MAG: HlyD family efflux transporter periplasmic adaptor subunit [Planctomycetota bacterium]
MQTLEAEEAQSARYRGRQLHGDEPIPPLVGKEPQLREAQVRVQAARAAVQGAQLNLDRTALKLPWPGRVVSTNVDVGGVVTVGQALATTYSTDIFEVTVPMRQDQLRWIHFDEDRATGEEVQGSGSPLTVLVRWPGADAERIEQQIVMPLEGSLRAVEGLRGLESKASHGLGWVRLDPTGEFDNGYMLERAHEAVQALAPFPPRPAADPEIFLGRPASMASVQVHVSGEAVELVGRAVRLESELDPVSRFARLVLEIDTHSLPSGLSRRLLPGLFADVVVRGEEVHGVAAIPRSALHDQNQVWVAVEDRLHFVTVEPVHTEEDQVWVRGLETGQELVLTDLEVVTDGMVIRKQVVEEQRADSVSGNAAQGMGATQ